MKITLNEITKALEAENYIADESVVYAVYTALTLEVPLLLEGEAGTGKTALAVALKGLIEKHFNDKNTELIRLQCYEGIDYTKVLYDVDYAKKLLRQTLYQGVAQKDIQAMLQGRKFKDAVHDLESDMCTEGEEFIIERPVLRAINPKISHKKVLLIDEIDKADSEVENLLLEALGEYSLTIPSIGTIAADKDNKPIVVLTSNSVRELSEPLRRRCVYLYIDYASVETEMKILMTKANVEESFARSVSQLVRDIRQCLDLRKNPSIAESIQWADMLFNHLGVTEISSKYLRELQMSLNVLGKNKKDIDKMSVFLESEVK